MAGSLNATKNILVVGAGFSGAVYARELAERGCNVRVIDKRPHIAGNCYDFIDECGVRVHKYGPHLFHTSNETVVHWLSRFTDWDFYQHRVVARLPDGRKAPLPVNLDTVNTVFDKRFDSGSEVEAFLASVALRFDKIRTAEDHLYSVIGKDLTDLFFRPYTKKMWNMDLSEMSPDVVKRLKVRPDRNPQYFLNDSFQAMPRDGYTRLFENIFDHENIAIELEVQFEKAMIDHHDHVFCAMPIDEYYDFRLGELPYRSIKFHAERVPTWKSEPDVVVNYTDDGPTTRETWWHNIPGHLIDDTGVVLRTVEEPCDYKDNNMERYYPVKSYDGQFEKLYAQYKALSRTDEKISFIGRCGTYQYLDMHQVINQSLIGVGKWLDSVKA